MQTTAEKLFTRPDSEYQTLAQDIPLDMIFRAAVQLDCAIALWRLPNSEFAEACIAFNPSKITSHPQLEESPFGFLFCPFEPEGQQAGFFVKSDLYYHSGTKTITPSESATGAKVRAFIKQLEALQENAMPWHVSAPATQHSFQKEACFKGAVKRALAAIQAGEMEKVVMSRNALEQLPKQFNPVKAFQKMEQVYPRAFVSLVSIPGAGTWMGATPEVLVGVSTDKVFHTVALAGTQPATEDGSVANAIWRQKEIEEQAMVERYILKCFKSLRLREYTEVGPRTVIAGNLMHLRTDFKVDLKEVDFPTLATDMLRLLHPTSAVCGLPKEPAQQFIKAYEGYDRSYYSGFLGPVNSPTGTHVHVNLRCMELLREQAILFAGAGITAESNPEKEWQETEHKMDTMRQVLFKLD